MPASRRDPAPTGDDAPDHPAVAEPTPMVVAGPPDEPGAPNAPDAGDGHGEAGRSGRAPGRRWGVVLLVVGLAITGIVAANWSSPRAEVAYVDWYTGALAQAPPAPDGTIERRWSHPLPRDRELVGVDVVGRTIVVATRPRLGAGADGAIVVTGHDPVDGRVAWRRSLDEARPAVVVVEGDRGVLVANMGDDGGVADRFVWDRTALVALDPTDGSTRWRHDFPDDDGAVQVRPDGTVVTGDATRVTQLDPASGREVLAFPSVTPPDGPPRIAHRTAHGWAVPDDGGWQVADPRGQVEFAIDDPDGRPFVGERLVVASAGSELVARQRPTGEESWRVPLDGEVLWVEPVASTSGDDGWLVGVRGEDDDVTTIDPVLVRDGRVVGRSGPGPTTALASANGERLGVVVDGEARTACRRLDRPRDGSATPACPDRLALLDADGEVLARQPEAGTSDLDPSLTWQATDVGLVTIERGVVRLSRWADLSPVWSIPLERPILRPVRVATAATGVAVGRNDVGPARVDWYG